MYQVFKRLICVQLAFLMVWTNLAYAFQSTESNLVAAGEMTASSPIERVFQQLDQLSLMLDRTQFDQEALLDSLDYEGERIIQHVKEAIHFQAYAGVLRGPQGTLISQSGNALDQSLLLAKLLKDAGYEARIARGNLPSDGASQLARQMGTDFSWPPAIASRETFVGWMQKLIPSTPSDPDEFQERMDAYLSEAKSAAERNNKTVDRINKRLADALPADLRRSITMSVKEDLTTELGDYYWVEYKLDAGAGWQATHPAFSAPVELSLDAIEYFSDSVPAELQHRVRLQVFLERSLGGKHETFPLMSAWERPAANAAYQPQILTIFPHMDFPDNGNLDLLSALNDAKFYSVFFNGDLAPDGQVFTIEGLVGPPDAVSPSGEFIATVSEKGLRAVSALSDIGTTGDFEKSGLTRIWFEFTRILPSGESRTITREVLATLEDGRKVVQGRVATEENWKSELRAALYQSWEVDFATGPLSPAFTISRQLSLIQEAKPTIEKLFELQAAGTLESSAEVMREISPFPDLRAARFFGLANSETGLGADHISYLASPMVVAFGRGFGLREGQLTEYKQTDIIFNERRSLDLSGDVPSGKPLFASKQGIRDTIIEVLPTPARKTAVNRSAFPILEAQDEPLLYVGPAEASKLEDLEIPEPMISLARAELRSGYGLILAQNVSSANSAWWRVETGSGTVTGMAVGPGGYGGLEAAEWIIIITAIVATVLAWIGYFSCWANYSGVELFCCLVDSFITNRLIAALAAATAYILSLGGGAVAAQMGASSAQADLVMAIANAAMLDVPMGFVAFTNLRLRLCEGMIPPPPPPPDDPAPCPPQINCPIQ